MKRITTISSILVVCIIILILDGFNANASGNENLRHGHLYKIQYYYRHRGLDNSPIERLPTNQTYLNVHPFESFTTIICFQSIAQNQSLFRLSYIDENGFVLQYINTKSPQNLYYLKYNSIRNRFALDKDNYTIISALKSHGDHFSLRIQVTRDVFKYIDSMPFVGDGTPVLASYTPLEADWDFEEVTPPDASKIMKPVHDDKAMNVLRKIPSRKDKRVGTKLNLPSKFDCDTPDCKLNLDNLVYISGDSYYRKISLPNQNVPQVIAYRQTDPRAYDIPFDAPIKGIHFPASYVDELYQQSTGDRSKTTRQHRPTAQAYVMAKPAKRMIKISQRLKAPAKMTQLNNRPLSSLHL